jgi:type IV pilus biogenesis protein CpaD/CtpE
MDTDYKNYHGLIGTLLLTAMLAGCVSTEPERVEADFGNSVNQMIQAQTHNPEAAARTESIPVKEMDGEMAINTLEALRKDTKRETEEFNNLINVQIGGGSSN